jgi:hypothetical protein
MRCNKACPFLVRQYVLPILSFPLFSSFFSAYVNGHIGNERLRKMALERKSEFDSGTYTEKRKLATEIVDDITKTLSPPGRFLKKASKELIASYLDQQEASKDEASEAVDKKEGNDVTMTTESGDGAGAGNSADTAMKTESTTTVGDDDTVIATVGITKVDDAPAGGDEETPSVEPGKATATTDTDGNNNNNKTSSSSSTTTKIIKLIDDIWEELSYDKAIHKACQVMRDISRPDRKYREERKNERISNKRRKLSGSGGDVVTIFVPTEDSSGIATTTEVGAPVAAADATTTPAAVFASAAAKKEEEQQGGDEAQQVQATAATDGGDVVASAAEGDQNDIKMEDADDIATPTNSNAATSTTEQEDDDETKSKEATAVVENVVDNALLDNDTDPAVAGDTGTKEKIVYSI